MVRDEGLPVHREDVTVHRADPGHRLVVQVEHLGSIKWPKKHKYDCVIIGLKLWEEAPHRTRRQCRHHHHKHRFVVDVIINIITSQDRWRPSSPSLSLLLSPSSQSSSSQSSPRRTGRQCRPPGRWTPRRTSGWRTARSSPRSRADPHKKKIYKRALKMLVFNIRQVDLCVNCGLKEVKRYIVFPRSLTLNG